MLQDRREVQSLTVLESGLGGTFLDKWRSRRKAVTCGVQPGGRRVGQEGQAILGTQSLRKGPLSLKLVHRIDGRPETWLGNADGIVPFLRGARGPLQ